MVTWAIWTCYYLGVVGEWPVSPGQEDMVLGGGEGGGQRH